MVLALPPSWVLVVIGSLSLNSAVAQRINFGTLPNGSAPANGMLISNQYSLPPYGVSFQFEDGSYPRLAKVGGRTAQAFIGRGGRADLPAPGQDVGQFFLADSIKGRPLPFIITYVTPVAAASGVIIDLDRKESWRIQARDSSGRIVREKTMVAGVDSAGNATAAPWAIQVNQPVIASIRLEYDGKNDRVGFAFDNFSPATTFPEIPVGEKVHISVSPTTGWYQMKITRSSEKLRLGSLFWIETAEDLTGAKWTRRAPVVITGDEVSVDMENMFTKGNAQKLFFRLTAWAPEP